MLFFIDLSYFIKINGIILLSSFCLINYSLYKYYNISKISAINNSLNHINITEKYNIFDILYAVIFSYFILLLRLVPYFRILLNIERVSWNRFK